MIKSAVSGEPFGHLLVTLQERRKAAILMLVRPPPLPPRGICLLPSHLLHCGRHNCKQV